MSERLPQYDRFMGSSGVDFFRTFTHLMDIAQQRVIPAIVEKTDDETNKVTVRPLTTYVYDTKDGEEEEKAPTYEVPIVQMNHGCFALFCPIFVGDTGYLIAGDRNATTAMEKNSTALTEPQGESYGDNEGPKRSDDFSMLNFDNGIFLPCSWAKPIGKNEDGLVFKETTKDGEVFSLKLKDGKLTLNKIDLTADTIDITAENGTSLHGTLDCYDDVHFHSGCVVGGNLSVLGDATIEGGVDIGKNDHAHLVDTEFIVGYDSENKRFNKWSGKVVRTEGDTLPSVSAVQIVADGGGGGGGSGTPSNFGLTLTDKQGDPSKMIATITDGAVQIGGFTRFVPSGLNVEISKTGVQYLALDCYLDMYGSSAESLNVYASTGDILIAQADYMHYIYPIYRILNGVMDIDYRPMPNAGCWEGSYYA